MHFSASLYGIFMQLGCSMTTALPALPAWSCRLGAWLEWLLLTPVLALPQVVSGLTLSTPVLALASLLNSMLQVLALESTAELLILTRPLVRRMAARRRVITPPPFRGA